MRPHRTKREYLHRGGKGDGYGNPEGGCAIREKGQNEKNDDLREPRRFPQNRKKIAWPLDKTDRIKHTEKIVSAYNPEEITKLAKELIG